METRVLDAYQPHERERDGYRVGGCGVGGFAAAGRARDVRVQVGQDHVGQVRRQPFGPRRAVPLNRRRIARLRRRLMITAGTAVNGGM